MDLSPELLRGTVMPAVLGLLERRPQYGYEMIKQADARSNGVLKWREGSLYPALHRLEAKKLIKGKWKTIPNDEPGAGKQRKYYHLTAHGRRELAAQRKQWKALAGAVDVLLFAGR